MDDKSLSDQLSNLFPAPEGPRTPQQPIGEAQKGLLIDSLKAFAWQAGGDAQPILDQFLSGKGELAEVTRAAAASGSSSATNQIVNLLTSTLKISPAIANIIAPILLKLVPFITSQVTGTSTEKETTAKKKPRPKTSTSKKETSSSKKTAAKPKKTTAKSTTKKKTSASSK